MLRRTGHQAQQAIQLRNREIEEERSQTLKKLEREALVSKVLEDDERLEEKRLMKRMMMEQREREIEDAILRVCLLFNKTKELCLCKTCSLLQVLFRLNDTKR